MSLVHDLLTVPPQRGQWRIFGCFMFTVCKTEAIIPEESLGHSSMQQRQTPCAHYLSITDQLLWSHSSRLQIRPVLVVYSSTSSRWEAPTGPRAISPSGQSVKFTPQQVIVVDSGRQVLLWGKNSFWKTSWNSASSAATRWRPFLKKENHILDVRFFSLQVPR